MTPAEATALQLALHAAHKARRVRFNAAASVAAHERRKRLAAARAAAAAARFAAMTEAVRAALDSIPAPPIAEEMPTSVRSDSYIIKIAEIREMACIYFGVTGLDLLSSRRNRTIVRPRQIAMYLAKVLTPRSLPEIGRRFGGRDHTTVLHAVRKVEALIVAGDEPTIAAVAAIRAMVEGRAGA